MYGSYTIDRDTVLVMGKDSKLFEAKNKDYPNHPVACRFYDCKVGIDPKDAMYLKFLRHLGKKHASIVHTWELFVDDVKNIEIFQEYCANGSLEKYAQGKSLDEKEISLYAWQLLRGMDFLGDIGIAHREVHPKNLVLRAANEYNVLKISNFRQAVVYWSVQDNDITYIPCLPAKQQSSDGENFQPPEVYGDPKREEYDPIIADTWSFGAVIYFMATKKYPYNPTKQSDNLEEEIQNNVKKMPVLSDQGKELVGNTLRTNAGERIPVGFVEKTSWFESAKKVHFDGCFVSH